MANADSLRVELSKAKSDTTKIDLLVKLAIVTQDPERRGYLNKALKLSFDLKELVRAGDVYEEMGNGFYPNELDSFQHYYTLSLNCYERSGNKNKIAKGLNNVGIAYWYRNDLSTAISYYLRALEINEQTGNDLFYAINCVNISMLYQQLEEYDKALEFHDKIFDIDTSVISDDLWFSANNTKGITLYKQKKFDEAKRLHLANLALANRLNDPYSISMSMQNLGLVYNEMSMADSAIYFTEASLKAFDGWQDFQLTGVYNNLAAAWVKKGDRKKALSYYTMALDHGLKSNYKPWLAATYKGMAEVMRDLNKFEQSVKYYELFIATSDSLKNEENQEALNQLEAQYQSKQKAQEIELLKKNDELSKVVIKNNEITIAQQDQRQYFFIITGVILCVLVVVILLAFLAKRRTSRLLQVQKSEIEEQHILLVAKNNEIVDSLNYAKRLQSSILPSSERLSGLFGEHFVFYQPKDIVSGDFYWLHETERHIYIAVADCTGHGVPGAIVSVVCANALSVAVQVDGLINPAAILNSCRDQIKRHFSQSNQLMNDGMDISLCVFSKSSDKMVWCGANNPLWIIRAAECIELKPNKQPVGRYSNELPFQSQEMQLQKGDKIYLFSDGFADQFGGDKGKKFKAATLKGKLVAMADSSMGSQLDELQLAFETWRGNLEQVDDVCLLGIRI